MSGGNPLAQIFGGMVEEPREHKKTEPTILVHTLNEILAAYRAPCPFQVGDLVMPRRGMPLARGLPAISYKEVPMTKSKQTRETARALVNPLFAWTSAILKGGEIMLDSIEAATKSAQQPIRVAVLTNGDAPTRRARRKSKGKNGGAKRARRR